MVNRLLEEYPETVIELYHAYGTSEQFHSELKSDMGVELLPSGKFKTNATVLQAAMMTFNTLRRIGQEFSAIAKSGARLCRNELSGENYGGRKTCHGIRKG